MKGIILALSLFLVSNLSLARDVSIDLRLTQQNVNVGDEVSVKINIDPVFDLKGINILVSFDNSILEYKSAAKGVLIEDFVEDIVPDTDSNRTGKIEYLAVLESPGPGIDLISSGNTILTLNFAARAPGEAWIELDPNDVYLGDSAANAIPAATDTDRQTIQIGQTLRLKRVFSYPNPGPKLDNTTVIRVEALALLEDLEAKIYDISGQLVKEIDFEDFGSSSAPVYEYSWDCKNEENQDVANGTYILWVKASFNGSDDKHETWKIAVLR